MEKVVNYIVAFLFLGLTACKPNTTVTAEAETKQTYTCPMHPQVVQEKQGTCPICGMDLVPFDKSSTEANLMLGMSQRMLANVVTDTVRTGSFSSVTQFNGRIAINPEQIEMISSRVPGRIEQLNVRETGVFVRRGQPLYKIYSEQLSALQQEYLVTAAQADQFPGDAKFQQIESAARQRLLLFDQTEAQIRALRTSKNLSPYVTYYAPATGVVSELFVAQGQYVAEGGPVMRLENYSSLWVEADVYPSEANAVRVGQTVTVRVAGFESGEQQMRIEFIAPSLQSGSQLLTVRGSIQNPAGRYRVGMQATVEVPVTTISNAVTLPVDAVIRDGNGTHVWVETEPGTFEARTVRTGAENYNRVEILEGLKAGDVAVISGAYLLYSEFILKKGTTPAGEHNH
ncbi:MAG TPA: efflux RND transporter periplasmic adaptor subunit [Flavisolibacter sp.]|jgi:Cu(I)/Ag(I) efflux system membrane fusion protein|nr:efflux RND transporter periplasmic adaptor subunit [Flavisolibacter sp.]